MSVKSDSEVVRLLRRIKKGDRVARSQLFALLGDENRFGRKIRSLAHRIFSQNHPARILVDSGDLARSAIREAYVKIDGFRGETAPELLAWLKAIIVTKRERVSRRKEFEQRPVSLLESPRDDSPPPISDLIVRESVSELYAAVNKLQLSLRVVVELRLEDKSCREIAGILGLKEATVRQRECRAMKQLREMTEG